MGKVRSAFEEMVGVVEVTKVSKEDSSAELYATSEFDAEAAAAEVSKFFPCKPKEHAESSRKRKGCS